MITTAWRSFLDLLLPRSCGACSDLLLAEEKALCTLCLATLPHTSDHKRQQNPTAQKFWGRVPLQRATALFHFSKGTPIQRLLHAIKYQSRQQIACYLGAYYSHLLHPDPHYQTLHAIIPVPLHHAKAKQRGYNQSASFAAGLSNGLHIPYELNQLIRANPTETQTRKTKAQRWENVAQAFKVTNPPAIKEKNLLLVDDLITTGATIEACTRVLLAEGAQSVSVAALAVAHHL